MDENNDKKITKPKATLRDLARDYHPDRVRTRLASKVTDLLVFVIIFNTVATFFITMLIGFKLIELDNVTYISFIVSSIMVIGLTTLIIRLLPNNRPRLPRQKNPSQNDRRSNMIQEQEGYEK